MTVTAVAGRSRRAGGRGLRERAGPRAAPAFCGARTRRGGRRGRPHPLLPGPRTA
ncbi:Hypothetical protein SCLAV_1598 [Streptomyces clavuligerus]|uniref:Uncharacterized protein n=1 Tax=Streptomyces clavuligerus TaxID=1901 RepID=B5GQP3_STRCL|nr:hypothetical protein SSCG_01667 [Streptomyces clavuligerus]EFG06673.1 Hypothetical protein SCLAV_1598 [Streptomyces clavuligerus]